MGRIEPARLDFGPDGIPRSAHFGDVYHSAHGGPAQARHVFLNGNGLPARWAARERFTVLETGFGLGLNFLATWQAWRNAPRRPRRLHVISVEKFPLPAEDLVRAHAAWPEFAELAAALRARWPVRVPGIHRLHFDDRQVTLTLVFDDACTALPTLEAAVDAFYLDGFSPACNPELWSPALCRALARLSAPGATLATWSVAGLVREALAGAGFDLEKRPGFAGKREMLTGRLRDRKPDRHPLPAERRAVVIGAGLAGSLSAHALAAEGWSVTLLEAGDTPASGASGNLAGVLRPLPSADDNRLARLTRAGFLATRALFDSLPEARGATCGVLHLAREPMHEAQQRRAVEQLGFPGEFLRFVTRDEAATLINQPVDTGGWFFPGGGWVAPATLCRAALAAFPERLRLVCQATVDRLEATAGGWALFDPAGALLAETPVVIMASGVAAPRFAELAWLPQRSARGQVSHLPATACPPLPHVLCKLGYATPAIDGFVSAGATLQIGDPDPLLRMADHAENLARLRLSLPGVAPGLSLESLTGRVGFRPMSPDRLPIVGAVPRVDPGDTPPPGARLAALPRWPGLWCVQGFGARGIVWSVLMADLLTSRLEGAPLPVESDLVDAVDPGRFLVRPPRRPTRANEA